MLRLFVLLLHPDI